MARFVVLQEVRPDNGAKVYPLISADISAPSSPTPHRRRYTRSVNRRTFLRAAAAAPLARAKAPFRVGVTDWNLKLASKLEAVSLAASLGFAGVEVSLGRQPVDGQLPLAITDRQNEYLAAAKQHNLAVAGTCLDILHVNYLKNDKLGQKWVAQGIPATKRLNAKVMLLPFFGKGALSTRDEMTYVGDALRELAPEAEKAGVVLGLENTINAADNLYICERSRSQAVRIYYDCGNLKNAGFDPLAELDAMGVDHICQVHIKDNPHYLGEGPIDIRAVLVKLGKTGYSGWVNLETNAPSGDVAADMRKNLRFVRNVLA
jgi:L-ribulose-5-phosphate 3-epimerase